MKYFFSCDWGTSTFRLRLVDAEKQTILSEIKTDYGIASAFDGWKQAGAEEKERIAFYETYISEQVTNIRDSRDNSLSNLPVVLSGMASSTIGMLEMPYSSLPFKCNGIDLSVQTIAGGTGNYSKIIIISGVRTDDDVIRGEETMLTGCNVADDDRKQVFIFPGTHSKHIVVRNGIAVYFTTYMTGELFSLLSTKSILAASVKKPDQDFAGGDQYFTEGVIKGASTNIMNSIFHVRTNQLFSKMVAEENHSYLSGLLIGHELKDISNNKPDTITLVSGNELKKSYLLALNVLGFGNNVNYKNADDALINGQRNILEQKGYMNW